MKFTNVKDVALNNIDGLMDVSMIVYLTQIITLHTMILINSVFVMKIRDMLKRNSKTVKKHVYLNVILVIVLHVN
jgi:hypothetical protein